MTKRRRADGDLRKRAEARLQAGAAEPRQALADLSKLTHELDVYRLELELQNDELRTAQLEGETALARFTELFDFAPLGYVVLDQHGVIRQVNHEAAHLLSAERGRLVGARLSERLPSPERLGFDAFLDGVLRARGETRAAATRELTLAGDDGPRTARVSARSAAGPEPQALVALQDITALKHAEGALRDELRHKDDFIAMLSHELRNPLAPIRTSLAVLDLTTPDDPRAVTARATIDRQVTHLTRLVEDLLDVSRISSGKVRLMVERLELRELVRTALEELSPRFETAGVVLDGEPRAEPVWLDADRTRLRQVVGNLLANSLKFTGKGGCVEVRVTGQHGRAVLTVKDSGVGLAPEVQPYLFEPFMQAPQSLARSQGGLGLGLAMVKGLVELHGGSVEVASAGLGRGAVLTVRLPLAGEQPLNSRAKAPARNPGTKAAPDPVPSRRVLIIEDNHDAATAMHDLLEVEGHLVHVTGDGPSGLSAARTFRPDIVICDIGLPGMIGYQVAEALRAEQTDRRLYLVAISGYSRPEDRRKALAAGFDRHLAKPTTFEDLTTIMRDAERARQLAAR